MWRQIKTLLPRLLMAGCLLAVVPAQMARADEPDGRRPPPGRRIRLAGGKQVRQHMASSDAGDFYNTPQGPRHLRRSHDHFAVRGSDATAARARAAALKASRAGLQDAETLDWGDQRVLLRLRGGTHARGEDPRARLADLRGNAALDVDPVFVDPGSGLLMVVESRIVVCLAAGVSAKEFFGGEYAGAEKLPGTRDQYLADVGGMTAEQVLAECVRLSGDARVVWAEPGLRCEGRRCYTPNDTHFASQWHLKDSAPGSVSAQTAWDNAQGDGVVIAIIDDGVQTTHPDLLVAAGGTNVLAGTSNVDPADPEDMHGTSVAGVAAAVGNNAVGVAGVAFRSRVLPVKVVTGDNWASNVKMAAAFRFAAGLLPGSAGADIINCSLALVPSTVLDSALADAVTLGRGGRGCAVFAAAGNGAASWAYFSFPVAAGTHTFKFEYKKNNYNSEGLDCVWLDEVYLPGIGTQGFEDAVFPPSGWTTGGSAVWQRSTQPEWAKDGGASGTASAQSGDIANSQTTWLQTVRTTTAGTMEFYLLTSTENYYDVFNLYIDGVWQKPYGTQYAFTDPGGIYTESEIAYPANHASTIAVGASTDGNQRTEYSQFGTGLDFVTPSSGGSSGIWTTDRTGTDGYAAGDYTSDFGGTSSSTPLAAGIGAQVLSRNATLSAVDLRGLLRRSCAKIGGVAYEGGDAGAGGWNKYYGYGKLMASLAVPEADVVTVQYAGASSSAAEHGGTVAVAVQLSAVSALPVTVPFTVSGSASGGGTDYAIPGSPVTIPAGSLSASVPIAITDDDLPEDDETVVLTMGTPVNADMGATTVHTLTITDNDVAVIHVAASRPDDSGSGFSWETAKKTLQAGIDLATDGMTVLVADGTYNVGGRAYTGHALANRVVIAKAIAVHSLSGPAVTIIQGSGTNAYGTAGAMRCVFMYNGLLDGFTLAGGATLASGTEDADKFGGGVCMYGAAATAVVTNCVIQGSKALRGGGASHGTLVGCTLAGNAATYGGGASEAKLANCLLVGNAANYGGGASDATLKNCTLAGNMAGVRGGGAYEGALDNCIVWGNTLARGTTSDVLLSICRHTCASDVTLDNSCIKIDPLFTDAAGGNYRLRAGSPCINEGDNALAPASPDLDGRARIYGRTVDMGAYEHVTSHTVFMVVLNGERHPVPVEALAPFKF